MLRIFVFFLLILALGFGFAWIADRPGVVELVWQGNLYKISLMTALAGLVALIAAVLILWTIVRSILNAPQLLGRWSRQRKKDRGYAALTQGLIAAGSGDAATARRFAKDSAKLLGQAPIVGVLDAQTSLLEGKREKARDSFEAMLENDETKLIGLRGLFLEAEKQGANEAARQYVEQAAEIAPSVPWAGNAKLRYRASDGDWSGALNALDSNRAAGLIEKADAKRQRAVLLTAHAMAEITSEPGTAAKLAKEAHKLAPDLVPAAVVGATAYMRNNDLRKASNMIEAAWKREPHPELAQAYVNLRIGDSVKDRLKRATNLANLKANHPEGKIAIAEAAIDAQDWDLARDAMGSVITNVPTQRACLIMADIEEGEHGDKGRMRDWLARAVRAPKDAVWTADGYVSETWLPLSPVTGKVDAFEWKVPVEQLGENSMALDSADLEALMSPVAVEESDGSATVAAGVAAAVGAAVGAAASVTEAAENSESVADAEPIALQELAEDAVVEETEEANDANVSEAEIIEEVTDASVEDAKSAVDIVEAEAIADVIEEVAIVNEVDNNSAESDIADTKGADEAAEQATEDTIIEEVAEAAEDVDLSELSDNRVKFPLDRRPDDPGIVEEPVKKKRFGLF